MSATVRDLFCGAGGSSLGSELAGAQLRHALNHWARAVETHATNFQQADHSCADIASLTTRQIRRFDPTDILWASPECTNHSLAKGARRRPPQAGSLFDDGPAGDAEQDRSRATMWDVVRFCEQAQLKGRPYKAVIVENVVDVVKWGYGDDGGLFNAWLSAMRAVGYEHECVYLNSMFCWPTPTVTTHDKLAVVVPYTRTGEPRLAQEQPMPTLTTRDRPAVLWTDDDIDDCLFRMFALREIAGAMVMAKHVDGGHYVVTGNKREQMAQYGNAVTPPAARELFARVLEVLA